LHRQHAPLRFRSGTRGLLCVCARDLERSFESFRTAVREEDAIETRNASEPLRDLCRELVVVEVRRVNQLRRLLRDRLQHGAIAVAERVDTDAADEVEIL